MILEHIKQCETCRKIYEKSYHLIEFPMEVEDEKFEKTMRNGFRKINKMWLTICCVAIGIVAVGVFTFCKKTIQIPYDMVHLKGEIQESLSDTIVFEDGTHEDIKCGGVKISSCGLPYSFTDMNFKYKEILYKEKKIPVVFVNLKTSMLQYLLSDKDNDSINATWIQGNVEDEKYESAEYIYYIDKGIDGIDNIENTELQQLIDKYGTLLWKKETVK